MANIWTIYKRELRNYFNSPIAYIFIIIFLIFMSFVFFFFTHFYTVNDASMRTYFGAMPWFFAFFTAAIAMRLWSEEKKVGTFELLMTMPVRSHEIVLAKYLAGLTILLVTLILTGTVPITVAYVGDPDWGKVWTGYLGAFLCGALFMGIGAFVSATTENQIVALMVAVVAGLLLLAFGMDLVQAEIGGFVGQGFAKLLAYFSPLTHSSNMQRGIVDLRNVIYFLSMTSLALLMNHIAVESRKY
jgi:ABC-2 type transport system permease protein